MRRFRRQVAMGVAVAVATAVASAVPGAASAASTPSPTALADAAYARMTTAQRIGQLFMGAVPDTGSTYTARTLLARYHVGNVVLLGQSTAGTSAVASLLKPVRTATTQAGVAPYLSVDQEGGYVQHLKGSGFSTMPTALHQGGLSTTTLRADWHTWASQLKRAGVNLDLAPVADVVPSWIGTSNQPIGRYYREYGHTPSVVGPHVAAVVHGIHDAGISATVKHFPGLGRASGNTDTTVGVTDPTTSGDPYLATYKAGITAGVPIVMVSTAIYPNIDPGRIGAFSHLIVTEILRYHLGFTGVIISDSLTAASVRNYSYSTRAVRALDAGVDILLVTSNSPISAMTSAIASRMKTDAAFASVVKTAVLRVLTAKAKAGLVRT